MIEEQNNQNNEWKKRELGAFWTRESAKGKYLSGSIEIDELGVKKKIILAGPIPIRLKPFVYQKRGINVISPAQNK